MGTLSGGDEWDLKSVFFDYEKTMEDRDVNTALTRTNEASPKFHNTPFALSIRSSVAGWAPVPLRLIVGYGFLVHGLAKLSRGPDAFAGILQAIGVPAPHLMSWLAILTEVFGGIAVMLGAFVTFFSIPMAALLLVAMFTVHWRYGFSSIKLVAVTPAGAQFGPPGYECDLLYLACLVALVLAGPGPLAIDRFILKKRKTVTSADA